MHCTKAPSCGGLWGLNLQSHAAESSAHRGEGGIFPSFSRVKAVAALLGRHMQIPGADRCLTKFITHPGCSALLGSLSAARLRALTGGHGKAGAALCNAGPGHTPQPALTRVAFTGWIQDPVDHFIWVFVRARVFSQLLCQNLTSFHNER